MGTRKQYDNLYISEEDRVRLVRYRCRALVAESGNSNMSVEDAMGAFGAEANLIRELRQKYEIPAEDSVRFSLLDGMALEEGEEF